VKETQEAAPEAEPHPRVLRLEVERGVVELQLGQGIAEALEVVANGRVEAAEDGGERLSVAGQGLRGGVVHPRNRITDAHGLYVLEPGDHVPHLARTQSRQRGWLGRVAAYLEELEVLVAPHCPDRVPLLELPVEEAG
jgi:hypothetical protein